MSTTFQEDLIHETKMCDLKEKDVIKVKVFEIWNFKNSQRP